MRVKKYVIKDDDGCKYEVEEVMAHDEEGEYIEGEKFAEQEMTTPFSEDEVAALKKLLPHVDKLIEMVIAEQVEKTEEDVGDEDIDEETLVETDETKKTHDSKKSFGSINDSKATVNDSMYDRETEIALAWAKRFGGN